MHSLKKGALRTPQFCEPEKSDRVCQFKNIALEQLVSRYSSALLNPSQLDSALPPKPFRAFPAQYVLADLQNCGVTRGGVVTRRSPEQNGIDSR